MVHNRIKILRTLKGLNQKQMAELLHKSQSAYSRMESGELTITTDELKDIAAVLGCNPEDLLKEQGIINILQHNEKATAGDYHENDPHVFAAYHKEMLQFMAEQQQKAMEQMLLMMKEIIAEIKKP